MCQQGKTSIETTIRTDAANQRSALDESGVICDQAGCSQAKVPVSNQLANLFAIASKSDAVEPPIAEAPTMSKTAGVNRQAERARLQPCNAGGAGKWRADHSEHPRAAE